MTQVELGRVKTGTILHERNRVRAYCVLNVRPAYWGDGATGYQLEAQRDGALPFWARPEDVTSIYTYEGQI